MKEILENTVSKSKKVEHNEDREGIIYIVKAFESMKRSQGEIKQ